MTRQDTRIVHAVTVVHAYPDFNRYRRRTSGIVELLKRTRFCAVVRLEEHGGVFVRPCRVPAASSGMSAGFFVPSIFSTMHFSVGVNHLADVVVAQADALASLRETLLGGHGDGAGGVAVGVGGLGEWDLKLG